MSADHAAPTGVVASPDGVSIAYDRQGEGPPLIVVVGAFNGRSTGAPLAAALADQFTVFTYDRRGRGDSGDARPAAAEREYDDLAALITLAGGSASIFGFSSGALLSLRAAARGLAFDKLVLFDPPVVTDDSRPAVPADIVERLQTLISEGRRGEAVELFQLEVVGLPAEAVAQMRQAPFRPYLEAMAPSLIYDATLITAAPEPLTLAPLILTPTLVISGGEAAPWLQRSAEVISGLLPNGVHQTIGGLSHDIKPELLGPPVREFLSR